MSICCSESYTILQTASGKWFGFGSSQSWIKSTLCGKKSSQIPQRIDDSFPKGETIIKFCCSASGYFLLTKRNQLYTIGDNGYGELLKDRKMETWREFMIDNGTEFMTETWKCHSHQVVNMHIGPRHSFLFISNPLNLSHSMPFKDVFIHLSIL